MDKEIVLPLDIIGIGTSKAATTWIAACLGEHPEITISDPKETHMFAKKYDVLEERYRDSFRNASDTTLRAEFTPGYLAYDEAPARIARHTKQPKLLVCLRDPIKRIESAYNYARARQKPISGTFEDYTRKKMVDCLYATYLRRYYEYFAPADIKVMIFEDIKADPVVFIRSILEFVGVDATYVPPSAQSRSNVTSGRIAKVPGVHKTLLWLRKTVKALPAGTSIARILKRSGVNWLVRRVLSFNTYKTQVPLAANEKVTMSPELTAEVQAYLKEDLADLEKLLGRQLTQWPTVT